MNFVDANIIIEINRNNLFNDAFNGIMSQSPEELKKRLRIKYIGEEGLDASGLLRYFFFKYNINDIIDYILIIYLII